MKTRTSIALVALAAAGLMSVNPASAASGSGASPDDRAAVAAMPHSAAVSNGTPVQTSTGQHGTPRFTYQGAGQGNLSAGVPHVVGQRAGGKPIIAYTAPGS